MNGIEPRSTGELQLYKVLHRANLLGYYDTFISQGKKLGKLGPCKCAKYKIIFNSTVSY